MIQFITSSLPHCTECRVSNVHNSFIFTPIKIYFLHTVHYLLTTACVCVHTIYASLLIHLTGCLLLSVNQTFSLLTCTISGNRKNLINTPEMMYLLALLSYLPTIHCTMDLTVTKGRNGHLNTISYPSEKNWCGGMFVMKWFHTPCMIHLICWSTMRLWGGGAQCICTVQSLFPSFWCVLACLCFLPSLRTSVAFPEQ